MNENNKIADTLLNTETEMVKYPVSTINSILDALNQIPWTGQIQFHFAAELDDILHSGKVFSEAHEPEADREAALDQTVESVQ